MVLAIDGFAGSRCGYTDRPELVDTAQAAVSPLAECGDVDHPCRRSNRDNSGSAGALLEVCDQHDCSGDGDRAPYERCGHKARYQTATRFHQFNPSVGALCDH